MSVLRRDVIRSSRAPADREAAIKALTAIERHAGGMKKAVEDLRTAVGRPEMLDPFLRHVEQTLDAVKKQLEPVRATRRSP